MKSVLISIRPEWCGVIASGRKTMEVRKTRPKMQTPFKCYIYCTKAKHYFAEYGLYGDELFRIPTGEVKFGCSMEISCYDGPNKYNEDNFLNGKVIGEFLCNRIEEFESEFYSSDNVLNAIYKVVEDEDYPGERIYTSIATNEEDSENFWICSLSCLSFEEIKKYIGYDKSEKTFYGWHISDLVIYDKPKELSEFFIIDKKAVKECSLRERIYTNPDYTNGAYLPGTYICNKVRGEIDFCRGGCWKKTLSHPPQSWCYVEEVSE